MAQTPCVLSILLVVKLLVTHYISAIWASWRLKSPELDSVFNRLFRLTLRNTAKLWITGPPLQWRHNEPNGVSNHQPRYCVLNRLFTRRSKKPSKLRATGLCVKNSPVTGEFPAQMASYAEKVSIWLRHHAMRGIHRSPRDIPHP